ncbi:MAG: T9SS type A sorting domain-containing protein, partial [Bacteroidota bacterium]|nr:T9SS type A sorting domain-containing protein [Bacteroidota bacterium]
IAVEAQRIFFTAYPNPFQEEVTVNFALPQTQEVALKVFDSYGREISTLFQGEAKSQQNYEVKWQARQQASGIYLLQLQTGTLRQMQKVLLYR